MNKLEKRELNLPVGYNPKTQSMVALFAAQLEDQLRLLKRDLEGLEVKHLEWQPQPGMNTIGMLLAHNAVVEIWWINIAPYGIPANPDGEALMKNTIGICMDDDGLPIPSDGVHPKTLSKKTLEDYLGMQDRARALAHTAMKTWDDNSLESTYVLREREITRAWTLYHVLEHFAGHYGQMLLLMHLMRDAGVLEKKAT
ncbi:MAG: DinB family protein [candidate division Zixibacteria bacterium]|nr:DinB family protein [candidate division Zixibacteria bacterium]